MSKSSQAAKAVPEPQGTVNLRASLSTLAQARQAVTDAVQATAKAVVYMSHEELQALGDKFLRPVLTEVARARDTKAVLAVVRALHDMRYIDLTQEDAKNVIGAGYNLPVEAFVSDGKNTNLTTLLIAAIKRIPKDESVVSAVRALVSAKVRTDSFIDDVLASPVSLSEKLAALALSDGSAELHEETLKALEGQLFRHMDHNGHSNDSVSSVQKLVGLLKRGPGRRGADDMVRRLAAHQECAHAALVAEALPDSFDLICGEVLRSGSAHALASFWRAHSAKCDKKAFHEKLTEAMRPDPSAMAEAILDNRNVHCYPSMFHPMMMGPVMMYGGRRW